MHVFIISIILPIGIDQNFSNFPDDETDHGPKIGLIPDPTLSPELNDEMDNELCDSVESNHTAPYYQVYPDFPLPPLHPTTTL